MKQYFYSKSILFYKTMKYEFPVKLLNTKIFYVILHDLKKNLDKKDLGDMIFRQKFVHFRKSTWFTVEKTIGFPRLRKLRLPDDIDIILNFWLITLDLE